MASIFPISFKTFAARLSESPADAESSRWSNEDGDVTLMFVFRGIAVDAEEFEEDVDDEEADCGSSCRFTILCFIVPAFSLANGILSIESIDEFDYNGKFYGN